MRLYCRFEESACLRGLCWSSDKKEGSRGWRQWNSPPDKGNATLPFTRTYVLSMPQLSLVDFGNLIFVGVPVGTEFLYHDATHLVDIIEGFLVAG